MNHPHAHPAADSASHKAQTSPQDWWHQAVLHTVGGIGVGVLVVLAVLAVMALSPSLKAAGVDAGLALANRINMASAMKLGLSSREDALGIRGYVFVDLDAGRNIGTQPEMPASVQACQQLAAAGRVAPGAAPLDCAEGRGTNRYLLAEALASVYAAGAKAVVVDVELSANAYGVQPAEDARLREVFASNQNTPTFFVLPAEPVVGSVGAAAPVSTRLREQEAAYWASPQVVGLPVQMMPGLPARSFPDCYALVDGAQAQEHRVPSIPRAVAAAVQAGPAASTCPDETPSASRIVYTLPSSDVDLDRSTAAARQPALVELQTKLNRVYNRCLAASLWDRNSACSTPDVLRDRIVVLGSSASYRGDWHYTPLGEMPGSLILVNAIRSAIVYGQSHAKNPVYAMAYKLAVMLLCSLLWLAFWLQYYARRRTQPEVTGIALVRRRAMDALMLLLTVAGVLALSYALGFSTAGPDHSLDALLPGLTVGIEVFIEIVMRFVKWLEGGFARWRGWEIKH